jgi:hypothetical protein
MRRLVDGDKSPAESGDKSPHPKILTCVGWPAIGYAREVMYELIATQTA